ncbi:hypothetical protein K470DRAFT_214479 [Piedraia hortae CBS 480.64]|uniref:PH domain-containing protein n=1 Tax=Piedraia hortae CBS 480.64 TaxID=1314780 RepID=A0A6A7C256_9PEZI|nr:hypothetical protein K470DRAFT_214479 [Piedraia hortae CBS 480.64]
MSLPPDGLTARRLEHATAEHLHATTTRIFIGPIPDNIGYKKPWSAILRRNTQPSTPAVQPSTTLQPVTQQGNNTPEVPSLDGETQSSAERATSTTSLLGRRPQTDRAEHQPSGSLPGSLPGSPPANTPSPLRTHLRAKTQRLLALGAFHTTSIPDGEILKLNRMLIRIDTALKPLGNDLNEHISSTIPSHVTRTWREYILVCRKHTPQTILQLYQTRIITKNQPLKTHKHPKAIIPLDPKTININLYSPLDKTLCLWTANKIFYLNPQSGSTSLEWYTFLHTLLGWRRAAALDISVPDLNVTLRINEPFKQIKSLARESSTENIRSLDAERDVAESIIRQSREIVRNVPGAEEVSSRWTRLGLAWRRYDRLEWVYGPFEQQMFGTIAMVESHDLEVRGKVHYPTAVKGQDGQGGMLREPPPVEGFLARVGEKKVTRGFYYVQDQLLFYVKAGKAILPVLGRADEGEVLTREIIPYPLDGEGGIEWLTGGQDAAAWDRKVEEEAERCFRLVLSSEGFVDLTQITDVCEGDGEGVFELRMRNGGAIRLQAHDEETRDEWIPRLRALCTFWTQRIKADVELINSVRRENLQTLKIDEGIETIVSSSAPKWETRRAFASPTIYNFCGIAQCRTIHLSGVLFRKPRRYATFTRCFVVLCQGQLILFRERQRVGVLDLKDCYLYSGALTENDVLYHNRTFDSNQPGRDALPRYYPEDGWRSTDEDSGLTFVVWRSMARAWVWGDGKGEVSRLARVAKLGSKGRSVVFKARSRVERDRWVMGIQVEIERLIARRKGDDDYLRLVD